MVQAAKRKTRGYRTFKGFSTMIYLIAGKLELAVPPPGKIRFQRFGMWALIFLPFSLPDWRR